MKTAMQELIDRLKEEKDLFINSQGVRYETAMEFKEAKKRGLQSFEQGLHFETAIKLAEAMLEKEQVNRRELLLDFADYSERDMTSQTTDECVDNYLDLILNTKEK